MPGWSPPGRSADLLPYKFDLRKGWLPPGVGGDERGTQFNMPMGFNPQRAAPGYHVLMSPPGTQAPLGALNYTPKTKEVHGPGMSAPVGEMNLSVMPDGGGLQTNQDFYASPEQQAQQLAQRLGVLPQSDMGSGQDEDDEDVARRSYREPPPLPRSESAARHLRATTPLSWQVPQEPEWDPVRPVRHALGTAGRAIQMASDPSTYDTSPLGMGTPSEMPQAGPPSPFVTPAPSGLEQARQAISHGARTAATAMTQPRLPLTGSPVGLPPAAPRVDTAGQAGGIPDIVGGALGAARGAVDWGLRRIPEMGAQHLSSAIGSAMGWAPRSVEPTSPFASEVSGQERFAQAVERPRKKTADIPVESFELGPGYYDRGDRPGGGVPRGIETEGGSARKPPSPSEPPRMSAQDIPGMPGMKVIFVWERDTSGNEGWQPFKVVEAPRPTGQQMIPRTSPAIGWSSYLGDPRPTSPGINWSSYVGGGQDEPPPTEGWQPPVDPSQMMGIGNRFGQPVSMEGTHKGVDLQATQGTPAKSPVNGTVVKIEYRPRGLGLTVTIQAANGREHKLSHLASADVKEGDKVALGQVVGKVGATGAGATGPHLDYRVQGADGGWENPEPMMGDMANMPMHPDTVGMGQDEAATWGKTGDAVPGSIGRNAWAPQSNDPNIVSLLEAGRGPDPRDPTGAGGPNLPPLPEGLWPQTPGYLQKQQDIPAGMTPAEHGAFLGGREDALQTARERVAALQEKRAEFIASYAQAEREIKQRGETSKDTNAMNRDLERLRQEGARYDAQLRVADSQAQRAATEAENALRRDQESRMQAGQQQFAAGQAGLNRAQQSQEAALDRINTYQMQANSLQQQRDAIDQQYNFERQKLETNVSFQRDQMGLQRAELEMQRRKQEIDEMYRQRVLQVQQQQAALDRQHQTDLQTQGLATQLSIQGTLGQQQGWEVMRQSLQNPWVMQLAGMQPSYGQPGGPGWTPNVGGQNIGWSPTGTPQISYQQFAALTPFQKASLRAQTEVQGRPWGSVVPELRQSWAQAGGPTETPPMTQLQAVLQTPQDVISEGQTAETFGETPQNYWQRQQRKWSQATSPLVTTHA